MRHWRDPFVSLSDVIFTDSGNKVTPYSSKSIQLWETYSEIWLIKGSSEFWFDRCDRFVKIHVLMTVYESFVSSLCKFSCVFLSSWRGHPPLVLRPGVRWSTVTCSATCQQPLKQRLGLPVDLPTHGDNLSEHQFTDRQAPCVLLWRTE